MNQELMSVMDKKLESLKEAMRIKEESLKGYIARKDSLSKKEHKAAYDLQCSYNRSAEEYNAIIDDKNRYASATKENKEQIEKELLAKYHVGGKDSIETKSDFDKPTKKEMDPALKGGLIGGGISLLALALAIGGLYIYKNRNNSEEISVNSTPGITASPTPGVTPEPTVDPNLEPGSYGTFQDPLDPKQREARLAYIDKLDQIEIQKLKDRGVTKETIYETYTLEDKAAMMESLLAISTPDASSLDNYSNMYSDLTVHLQNHPVKGNDYWNDIYSYLYLPDNSKASALVKEFVDAYNKVAQAFTKKDYEATIKYGKEFNSLFIDKIIYDGLHLPNGISGNADYETPLSISSIESDYKYIAMKSIRFLKAPLTEISDYLNDGFCVPGCINGETGYTEEWSLEKTINEFDEGLPNQEILRDTGKVVREECLEVQYYKWLLEHGGQSYSLK